MVLSKGGEISTFLTLYFRTGLEGRGGSEHACCAPKEGVAEGALELPQIARCGSKTACFRPRSRQVSCEAKTHYNRRPSCWKSKQTPSGWAPLCTAAPTDGPGRHTHSMVAPGPVGAVRPSVATPATTKVRLTESKTTKLVPTLQGAAHGAAGPAGRLLRVSLSGGLVGGPLLWVRGRIFACLCLP